MAESPYIDIQILTGNMLTDRDPTPSEVALYVEVLRVALARDYPGATVNIDVQEASGAARPATLDYASDNALDLLVQETWAAWAEAIWDDEEVELG